MPEFFKVCKFVYIKLSFIISLANSGASLISSKRAGALVRVDYPFVFRLFVFAFCFCFCLFFLLFVFVFVFVFLNVSLYRPQS